MTGMFEGVKMKYSLLTPPLTPTWAADRIMAGIAREQEEVLLENHHRDSQE